MGRRCALVGALAGEDSYYGHGDDLQIEGQAPVAKVVEIVFDALGDGSVAAPAVDLSPPGNAGLEHVAGVVAVDFFEEALDEIGPLGARADDTHVAFEDVEELGQFIEVRFAQEGADPGPARIVVGGPAGVALFAAADAHGAEFEHAEDAPVEAYAILNKKD